MGVVEAGGDHAVQRPFCRFDPGRALLQNLGCRYLTGGDQRCESHGVVAVVLLGAQHYWSSVKSGCH